MHFQSEADSAFYWGLADLATSRSQLCSGRNGGAEKVLRDWEQSEGCADLYLRREGQEPGHWAALPPMRPEERRQL